MEAKWPDRHRALILQIIKYGVAGGLATLTHVAVFYLLSHFVLDAIDLDLDRAVRSRRFIINNSVAFLLANAVAYLLNVRYVFIPGRHGRKTEISLFFLVSTTSYVVGSWLADLMIRKGGFNSHVTQGAFIVTAVLINYVCRKFFIFRG